ncbi:MAG: DUF4838 domain-containing protein [Lentisphaeria bacterium]|nr:DUF4838 domain-containing protein [Lentisphaeria bacterium]
MHLKKLNLAVAGMLLGILAFAAPLQLAENGKTDYSIVVPDQPKGFDQQAADDLKNYLGKMTGAEFRIVPESKASGENLIYVGQTAFAKKQGIDFAKLRAEEWAIRPVGKNLVLSGGYPIGSFYAVWNVLNRLGCYSLTWDQDAVPSYTELTAEIPEEQKKPVFDGRQIHDGFPGWLFRSGGAPSVLAAYKLYKLRNGINGRQRKDDSLWLYSAHNISHLPQFHSLCLYVPLKLFKTHPEYFSMNEHGQRFRPRSLAREGSVCMSNPEVAKVALESLRKMIKKDREKLPRDKWPHVYDISTLDNSPYICKCPECSAITKGEGSETGLLLRFINHIATEIRKEYPEIIIRTFGYSSTVNPPTKTKPADNVLIQLCDKFTVSDPFRPLADPLNADRIPYFREWRKGAKRLMVWDYWNLGGNYYKPPRPDTVFNAIQSDFRFFRDLGVTDLFIECGTNPFAPQSFIQFSHFTGAQLMLDPEKDTKRLADIYFKYYYGPAAPRMQKLFDDICAGMKMQKNRQSSAIVSHWVYLTPEFMYQTYSDLKKLSASLPEGSAYRRRVDAERINFTWYAIAKRDSYRKIFEKNGVNIDDLIPECRTLAKAYIRRYPCKKPEVVDTAFEELFKGAVLNLPRPEKFKDVPPENFRMIAYPHFRGVAKLGSRVVADPDSFLGKALKSANPNPLYHGVNKLLPGTKHGFRTTQFKWGNHKDSGRVALVLKEVPQDEKYHWFRIPGKLELKPVSYFVGQGWAIQANTSQFFTLTDGNPLDNTWDEVWFSAKFTGPAYVKGSTKENAIYVEAAVLVRGREAGKK